MQSFIPVLAGFRRQPILVTTLVGAILFALVEFGVPITDGQQTAVQGIIAAVLAIFASTQVTSEHTLKQANLTSAEVVSVANSKTDDSVPTQEFVIANVMPSAAEPIAGSRFDPR